MVNFPSRIPDFDSRSPALLDLFLSSDASISSTMVFPPSENFDHVVVSGSIDFAGTFLGTLILMTQIHRYLFSPGANLGLYDISVTPNMVGKAITKLDLSKASGPNCISVVVLKNSEPELSYIIAELFNNCLKDSCFRDCWKGILVERH